MSAVALDNQPTRRRASGAVRVVPSGSPHGLSLRRRGRPRQGRRHDLHLRTRPRSVRRAVPPGVAIRSGSPSCCTEDSGGPPTTPRSGGRWRGTWPNAVGRLQRGVPAGGQGRRVADHVAGRGRCARPALRTRPRPHAGGHDRTFRRRAPGRLGRRARRAARRRPGSSPRVAVTGVVAQAGVLDLRTGAARGVGGTAIADLLGGGPDEVPERYDWADPIAQVPLAVPVVCVHGHDDDSVPIAQSETYVAAANAAGGDGRAGGERRRPHGARRSHVSGLGRRRERPATVPSD